MIVKNKKAGAKLLSIWWFLVIIIVFIGIVVGTSMFKSDKLDVREAESAVIVNRLIECVNFNGKLNEEIFNNTNFLNLCGFDSTIIDKSGLYFIKISLFDINNKIINVTTFGNRVFEEECKIALVADAKKYPRCFQRNISVISFNDEILKFELKAGSNYEVGAQ